jgi:hypothetical protein
MKTFNFIKYLLCVVAIIFIFINWKIAIIIFFIATVFHVIPMGPNTLLSVITGYLIIGGVVYLFISWKIAIALIFGGYLVTKFRIYGNKCNYDFYKK